MAPAPFWKQPHPQANQLPLRWINIALAGLVLTLIITSTFLANGQAVHGAQLNQLTQDRANLLNDTRQLRWQISQYTSLSYIQRYAENVLHMKQLPQNTIYAQQK